MGVTNKIPVDPEDEKGKQWDNPAEPENAADARDAEQLARQKKEAELRKANLTEDDNEDQ
jgi:hypothetical protein